MTRRIKLQRKFELDVVGFKAGNLLSVGVVDISVDVVFALIKPREYN